MAKKKFYAVKIGLNPGVYESWLECEAQVKGFGGAKYKSFSNREEAEEYMNIGSELSDNQLNITENGIKLDYDILVNEHLQENRIVAFTDGGYSGKNKICGYGVYILSLQNENPIEISDIVRTEKFISSNNIGPEVMAVISALDWTISNGFDKITIFHDYEGIGKWASGEYKAKSEISKWFIDKLSNDYNDVLDIKFIWVPGHSGIQYNEEADRLATEAINKNIKPQFKMNETYFSCMNVCEKDVKQIISNIDRCPDIEVTILTEEHNKITYCLKAGKERITINFFRKNSKTLIQGKPNSLFSLFLSFYTEKIPDFDLVIAYGKMRKQRIEFQDVENIADNLKLPDDYPEDAIKLIKQSVAERVALSKGKITDMYDYGHYVFPCCRALEGTIKYLFEKCGTHISEHDNIGGYFGCDSSKQYYLKGSKYKTAPYKGRLEKAYNIYRSNRHILGHFGELVCNIENDTTTTMIENATDAIQIIDDILDVIRFD